MQTSIKMRLSIWFLLVSSVFFAGLGFLLYYELDEIVTGSIDEYLTTEVQMLGSYLAGEEEHGHMEVEIAELSQAATGEYGVPLSGHYFQVSTAGGEVLGRSPSLALSDRYLPVFDPSLEPVFHTILGPEGGPLRLLYQTFEFKAGPYTIQAGGSLREAHRLIASFRNMLLIVLPALFFLSAAGIYLVTGRALRPLNDFSVKVGRITEKNLNERVEEKGIDTELRRLAVSFNVMLGHMEESFKRQREFLSNASHELRTPASVIKSYCDVTLARPRQDAEYCEALGKVEKVVGRMSATIDRILEVSRLDSVTFVRETEIDLRDVVGDVVKFMEPAASMNGIAIRHGGESVKVLGEREAVTEAFINIVDNAIKYNKPGGSVDIEVKAESGWAVVEVKDTGVGIPAKEQERIFERFHRADDARPMAEGSGLGLSIARSVVEGHGGRIEVEGEPGKGSLFRVVLPAQ